MKTRKMSTKKMLGSRHARYALGIVVVVVVLGAIGTYLYSSAFSGIGMLGESMYPTIPNEEEVTINTAYYAYNDVGRGDIVGIQLKTSDHVMIRRVIAIPGDTVTFSQQGILVNDQVLSEDYVSDPGYVIGDDELSIVRVQLERYGGVPQNLVIDDSRHLGLIPREYIIGKVML